MDEVKLDIEEIEKRRVKLKSQLDLLRGELKLIKKGELKSSSKEIKEKMNEIKKELDLANKIHIEFDLRRAKARDEEYKKRIKKKEIEEKFRKKLKGKKR